MRIKFSEIDNPEIKEIIKICYKNPLTTNEIAAKLGYFSYSNIQQKLGILAAKGWLNKRRYKDRDGRIYYDVNFSLVEMDI